MAATQGWDDDSQKASGIRPAPRLWYGDRQNFRRKQHVCLWDRSHGHVGTDSDGMAEAMPFQSSRETPVFTKSQSQQSV